MASSIELPRMRFTVDQYHRMGEAGVFSESYRHELLDGEIICMTPIGHRHAACVNSNVYRFTVAFQGRALVSAQNPLIVSEVTEPQPDIVLLRWKNDFYRGALPQGQDALLIVEACDTSIELDRLMKTRLYADAGIPELWLVNLQDNQVEVYRQPVKGEYGSVQQYERGHRLSCLAFPEVSWTVEEILGDA